MRILIDGGSFQEDRLNAEKKKIIFHCLDLLTKKKGDTDWLLLVDDSRPEGGLANLEIEKRVVKSLIGGFVGKKRMYRWQIPSIIKQSGAGLLMTMSDGAPGRPGIPQCNWLRGISPAGIAAGSGSLKRAARQGALFTFSEKDKKGSIEKTGRPADGIFVVYGGPEAGVLPLSWVEKEKAKIGFAGGKEYFLVIFTGVLPEGLVDILKAFSLFKKRQQSNMQLVFAGMGDPGFYFKEKLKSYKYRQDIHIRENFPETSVTKLVAAAYAVVSPFTKEATGLQVLNAFQAAVPVIGPTAGCQAEVAGEAALYAEAGDTAMLADRLMAIYKDETLRNSMINKGKSRLGAFGWQESVQKIWDGIVYSLQDY